MKRITLLLAVAAFVAVMTAVSAPLAAADPAPGKDVCKNGGYEALGFENLGDCASAANEAAKEGLPFDPGPPPECPPGSEPELIGPPPGEWHCAAVVAK